MRAEDVRAVLRANPFLPFRVRMVSGRTFDIPHRDFMNVTRTTAYIFQADEPNSIPDRAEIISLLLIESIQPLEPAPSA